MMTKAERNQLIKTYFKEVARIDGAVPCVQWRHRELTDLYLYSREDESVEQHEIVLVKSSSPKVDKALSHSVRHYFTHADELEILLRSVSQQALASRKAAPPRQKPPLKSFQPKAKPTFAPVQKPVNISQNFNTGSLSTASTVAAPPVNPASYALNRPSIPSAAASYATPPKTKLSRPKGLWVGLVIVICCLVAAFLMNPGLDKHRQAVEKSDHHDMLQSSLIGSSEGNSIDGLNTTLVSTSEGPISSPVQRNNFYLFSLTELRFPEYEKIVGVGLFGMVFIDEPNESSAHSSPIAEENSVSSTDQTVLENMRRAVIVAVMDKFFADAENEEDFTYKFVFHNRSNRNISSIQGNVLFSNDDGTLLKKLPLNYDRPLGIGERAVFHIVEELSDTDTESDAFVQSDLSDLSVEWQPSELLFKDGTEMSL